MMAGNEFVIGVNNAKMMVFHNRTQNVQSLCSVFKLAGKKGNLLVAVGSRITVHLDDGSKQTAEVRAGSGYLSQNPPDAIFGLGAERQILSIKVHWPNGTSSMVERPEPRKTLQIKHPDLTSGN